MGVALMALGVALGGACKSKEMKEKERLAAAFTERMQAFENRKRYSELTPEVLRTIPDAELEQAVMDFIDCRVAHVGRSPRDGLQTLSPGFRAVYPTWWVEAEVNNGGFNQYFWNSSGELARDAADGFKLLELAELAGLMERAIAVRDRDAERMKAFKNRGTIEDFSKSYEGNPLSALDKEFYALQNDLSKVRIRFIRSQSQQFQGKCGR